MLINVAWSHGLLFIIISFILLYIISGRSNNLPASQTYTFVPKPFKKVGNDLQTVAWFYVVLVILPCEMLPLL